MNQDTLYHRVRSVLAVSPVQAKDPSVQHIIDSLNSHEGICVTEITERTQENGNRKVLFGLICDDIGKELVSVIYHDVLSALALPINRAGKAFVLNPNQVRLVHRPNFLERDGVRTIYDSITLYFDDLDNLAFSMMCAMVMSGSNDAVRRHHQLDLLNGVIQRRGK